MLNRKKMKDNTNLTESLRSWNRQSIRNFFFLKMGKTSKVVICGMKGVGKTSILEQVIYGNVNSGTVSM